MKSIIAHIVELVGSGEAFSDAQVEEGLPIVIRKADGWHDSGFGTVDSSDMVQIYSRIDKEWKTNLARGVSVNRTICVNGVRIRCSLYTTHAKEKTAVTMRILGSAPPDLKELGLPIQASQFATVKPGLLLIAGATGAGKSTTIAAIVEKINETKACHIVTIEDPIEFVFERKKSVITQRECDRSGDVASFSQGVEEALRQRPDVIVIGEIRDEETAEAVLKAAESGHYIIASVHASSAVGALQKMMTFFHDDVRLARAASLAAALRGVIFQRLNATGDSPKQSLYSELLVADKNEIATALLMPERMTALEERLMKGQLPGSVVTT